MITSLRDSWHYFAREHPGRRFIEHYRRSQRAPSIAKTALRIGLGLGLTAGGVLLWFLPGPGWLLVAFGMAMFASESRGLATYLDRLEVFLRAQSRRFRSWWQTDSHVPRRTND